jgi:hypothetical protein
MLCTNQKTQQQRELLNKAYQMVMTGWSVIPLRGASDENKPKAPALSTWKEYQTRTPRFHELEHWFIEQGYGAIGVVLGRVSGIVVIDIDKPEIEVAFKHALPHLTNTYTVRSGNRNLPHYYYKLSPDLEAPARTGAGIEFRSDGQYVVAPNTVIGDKVWRVENHFSPITLTKGDLSAIYAFLGLYTRKQSSNPQKTPLNAEISPIVISSTPPPKSEKLTLEGLRRWYVENARIYGRNNALFAGGCYARDLGWTQAQVTGALMSTHVTQSPNGEHAPETTSQRMDEARRTLDSVFKHPPRPRKRNETAHNGLPNAVRERLLQLRLDNTARVLDGLILAGIGAGDIFTAGMACERLAEMGIGKNAVYQALGAMLPNGQTVLAVSVMPTAEIPLPPHPLHPSAIADRDKNLFPTQCLSGRATNAGKNRGRPIRQFIMPSRESLCERLGVKDMGSDDLSADDLCSPAHYRQAMHKAMIARAPKQYGRDWQAQRLGVHKKTIQRYDKKCGIQAVPQFASQPVGWMNCDKLCPDEVEYGVFVTDQHGKRHPAKKRMVQKLLAQKYTLTLHRQEVNYYFIPQADVLVGDVPQPVQPSAKIAPESDYRQKWASALERAMSQIVVDELPVIPRSMPQRMAHELGLNKPYPKTDIIPIGENLGQHVLPIHTKKHPMTRNTTQAKNRPEKVGYTVREYTCTEMLYATLRDMNADKSITKRLAKQWVQTYGVDAIEHGLALLKRKTNIQNPAGYLATVLRVGAKIRPYQY